jgi:RNA polymerase sigma-70 factor (ECF subfamily)
MTSLLQGVHLAAMGGVPELSSLILRCANREATAFNELYEHASPLVFGTLLRILKRRALAEEALQDVFVSVWQRAAQYEPSRGNALGWILAISRYRAIDLLRREHSAPAGVVSLEESATGGPDEHSLSISSDALLERCLGLLSEEQRRCIVLAFVDGSSHDEIAQRTGSPLGTIKSWIRRGLQSLRQCLES